MSNWTIRGIVITVTIVLSVPAFILATDHSYTEDFTTNLYKDAGGTEARWDTLSGVLDLYQFSITEVGTLDTPGNAVHAVVSGDLLIVSDNAGGLHTIDISDPSLPVLLDTYVVSGSAMKSAVAGDMVYVAAWNGGLVVLDISDPSDITYVGYVMTTGYVNAVDVQGDYAYLADFGAGLTLIDISDPASPVKLWSYPTFSNAYDVDVEGDLAYVADYFGGVTIINISDHALPVHVSTYPLSNARALEVKGDVAYVACYTDGFYTVDVSDSTAPVLLDSYDTPGICYDFDISGDRAFIGDGGSYGIKVVDISDPSNLSVEYSLYGSVSDPRKTLRAGEYLFVCNMADGISVQRIVSAMPPDPTSSVFDGYSGGDPSISGDYLFLPMGGSGLRVADISDPFNLVSAGFFPGANVYSIVPCGDIAYAAGFNDGLVVLDIGDPASPSLITKDYSGTMALQEIYVSGDMVCGANGSGGLVIYDVTDPSNPVQTASHWYTGYATGIAVAGDRVYLASDYSGLILYDISDPSAPVVLDQHFDGDEYYDVAISGDYAYASTGVNGLKVLDISDPGSIGDLVGVLLSNYSCRSVEVYGDQLFAAGSEDGLLIYDISDPSDPVFKTRYVPSTGTVQGVALNGDFAFISGGLIGLQSTRVYDDYLEGLDNKALSVDLPGTGQELRKVRLSTAGYGEIGWEFSVDQGISWEAIRPEWGWTDVLYTGSDLRWRAELFASALEPDVSPECTEATFDWIYDSAVIDSVVDVPGDQGGFVRVHFSRSALDFPDEATNPVTAYDIYRRVDDPLLVEVVSGMEGEGPIKVDGREYIVATSASIPGFPPGVWENVSSVHAMQIDDYLALVPTEADSAASIPYEAFVITTHTTLPATWYVSQPDSGYSVDNIAPGVPLGLMVAYNTGSGNELSWEASLEEDFQYYRIYRSDSEDFVPGPETLVHETTVSSWSDTEYDGWNVYYIVTAIDHSGNESGPASPGSVTGGEIPDLPQSFALHQNVPNPFNPVTTVRFDLPEAAYVRLCVYNVKGELVATLVDGQMDPGQREIVWDASSVKGRRAASGVYFYRLTAGDFVRTRKMVLLR